MNKNETIELLEKQLPGFYSVDQVIELIKGIEGAGEGFNIPALIEVIEEHINNQISSIESDNACDYSSAQFSLSGNEVELDHVDIEHRNIASEAVHGLEDVLHDFFTAPKD